MHPDLQRRLESLRRHRGPWDRDDSLEKLINAQQDDFARTERRLGAAADAWARVCPPDLLPRTALLSLNRGVLTLGAADAATRFALDRLLREGAELALIRACRASVRKVRVVSSPTPAG